MRTLHLQTPTEPVVEPTITAAICPILDEQDEDEALYALPERHRKQYFDDWDYSDLRM